MIQDNRLSTEVVYSPFLYRVRRRTVPLVDYEQGGVAIGDPSQGLDLQLWTLREDAGFAVLQDEAGNDFPIIAIPGATRLALAFDGQMRPFIAWQTITTAQFYRYDSEVSDFVITSLPSGSVDVCATLDDHRAIVQSSADILIAYCRSGSLYYRQQRDRYLVERQLSADVGSLTAMGMSKANRIQFRLTAT